ncbi:MAG TPA: FimV/HubP family polar landmark protein, partial [Pseudomonadales bacterium]
VDDDILSLDDTEHELSLDNDDELSLDLSSLDETQLDVAPAATDDSAADDVLDFDFSAASAGEAEEDVLELDGIGLEAGEVESAPSFDEELSESGIDELSLDELDFSGAGETPAAVDEESITPALASEDEEQETLSLADFDLDFDDIEPESGEQTMVRDAISEEELSLGEVAELASEPAVDAAPAASALQPHQSQALDVLENDDLAFLSDADEVATKLDLAQAYIDMGDVDGARDILLEVVKEGSDEQKSEATALLDTLD